MPKLTCPSWLPNGYVGFRFDLNSAASGSSFDIGEEACENPPPYAWARDDYASIEAMRSGVVGDLQIAYPTGIITVVGALITVAIPIGTEPVDCQDILPVVICTDGDIDVAIVDNLTCCLP